MRPTPVSAFGVTYPSIREAAAAFNLPESTLRRRLAAGADVEVALIAPANMRRRPAFIGVNSKAYHRVKWLDCKYATARQIVQHYRPDLVATYDVVNPTGEYSPLCHHTEN